MVFNYLRLTRFPDRLTMRGIVWALLSLAHSDYRSLGKWFTTIKTMSLLSAVCLTLIELTDWLSAVRGTCPAPNTRQAHLFESSGMAGASLVSPLCSPGALSASWTAQPVHCLVPQPYTPQEASLQVRHSGMPVGAGASAAVSTDSSTPEHLFRLRIFQMVALLM